MDDRKVIENFLVWLANQTQVLDTSSTFYTIEHIRLRGQSVQDAYEGMDANVSALLDQYFFEATDAKK